MEIHDASKGGGRHAVPSNWKPPEGDLRPPLGLLLYTVLTGLTPAARSSRGAHRARRGQSRSA